MTPSSSSRTSSATSQQGLSPREAAIKAMDEVPAPVIAIALVLCAVFVPSAFITGITGQFFRQFALTIAGATDHLADCFADIVAGHGALLLKPHNKSCIRKNGTKSRCAAFSDYFNLGFGWLSQRYGWLASRTGAASH